MFSKAKTIPDRTERARYLDDALSLGVGDDIDELTRLASLDIFYIRINPSDKRFKYKMPTGNEKGAYENQWVPGGKTKGGTKEAVLEGSENIQHGGSMEEMANMFDSWERL